MTKRQAFYADPSVANCAVVLVHDARQEIEDLISKGNPWYLARTMVLEKHADTWVRSYGRETADMAIRGVHAFSPDDLYPLSRYRADEDARCERELEEIRKVRHPREHEIRRLDVGRRRKARAVEDFLFHSDGMSFAHLIMYAAAALLGLMIAAARGDTRDAEVRACAAATTKQERHERRCWRYDAVERGTSRAYDRDAPRDWQKPKAWERR